MRLGPMVSLSALGVALALPAVAAAQSTTPKSGKTAMKMPATATAKCTDQSWSTSPSQQGACSSHGGVATWFGKKPADATARCTDGSYYENAEMQGACAGHGGIAMRYKSKRTGAAPKH